MGVPGTQFAFESIIVDHFFLKGNEFLVLVDRHSGMMSCHLTNYRGARESLKISEYAVRRMEFPMKCFQTYQVFSWPMKHRTFSNGTISSTESVPWGTHIRIIVESSV